MTVPVLSDYQYQFGDDGIRLDPNNEDTTTNALWDILKISGLDSPEVRLVEQERDGAHGSMIFAKYGKSRTITIEGAVRIPDFDSTQVFLDGLKANYLPTEGRVPFYMKHPNSQQRVAYCNSLGVRYDVTEEWNSLYIKFQVILIAEDPRFYSADETTIGPVGLPSTAGGMPWNLTFPFGPTTSQVGGTLTLENSGTVDSFPTYFITGAVTNPVLRQNTLGLVLKINYPLAESDVVVIDTANRSLKLNGASRVDLVDKFNNKWPLIIPGPNEVQFTGDAFTTTGDVTAKYRSAWF